MAVRTYPEILLPAEGLDLADTLGCGQTFSWQERKPGQFYGAAGPHAVIARQTGDRIALRKSDGSMNEEETSYWNRYFSLDMNYTSLQEQFCTHPVLAQCVATAPGIRVLRQPFWDTLLSFILSQNNHIPRIAGIVQRLCSGFGPQIEEGIYGFPAPETLAVLNPEDLAPLQAGYRAPYLLDAARRVTAGDVSEEGLAQMPTPEARLALMRIAGVGPKVADCVLLFGLGRTEVAPQDVWIRRALATSFPEGIPTAAAGYEGIAQQYIFHWARQNKVQPKQSD